MKHELILARCLKLKNSKKAEDATRFFKTGLGGYAQGDVFYGINAATVKNIAKEFHDLELRELKLLFYSPVHEVRMIGIQVLILQYTKAVKNNDMNQLKLLYGKFISWKKGINNWDLVDTSAPVVSGHYYYHYDDGDLFKLAQSKHLWDRRIAVVSCFYHIRQSDFKIPLKIITTCLYAEEDLMHKACGWMLREIGKRDVATLRKFLSGHAHKMPRTALRYAIEKFSPEERKRWMNKKAK